MNCEEYRQAIAEDPSFDGGAGHLSECAACQAYRAEMQALDQRIGRALALDVPELVLPELPDIESDNVVSLARGRRFSPPTWLAMAATVAVAAVLGVRLIGNGIEYESLADEVLAHVDGEPHAMRVTDVGVTDARLQDVVTADIAEMDHGAGLITYAQTCVINGHEVPHLVIQGQQGPIMILLMPEEMIDAAVTLSGEHVNGVILPVGNGSIAIVGERTEHLENIQKQVLNSVTWTT
jgi:hypothetical protein